MSCALRNGSWPSRKHWRTPIVCRERTGFPIFARASTPHGAAVDPDGSINGPVAMAGTRVCPGDIIVGDDDGVVVIPRAELEQVITAAETKGEKEAAWVAALKNGQSLAEIHGFPAPQLAD